MVLETLKKVNLMFTFEETSSVLNYSNNRGEYKLELVLCLH